MGVANNLYEADERRFKYTNKQLEEIFRNGNISRYVPNGDNASHIAKKGTDSGISPEGISKSDSRGNIGANESDSRNVKYQKSHARASQNDCEMKFKE